MAHQLPWSLITLLPHGRQQAQGRCCHGLPFIDMHAVEDCKVQCCHWHQALKSTSPTPCEAALTAVLGLSDCASTCHAILRMQAYLQAIMTGLKVGCAACMLIKLQQRLGILGKCCQ